MQRKQLHNRRSRRTREKVVRSFVELVLAKGYENLSASEVARHAGVGRSTLYSHFGSLSGILEASLENLCTVLAAAVIPGTPADRLIPLLQHFRAQVHRNAAFFREPILSLWSQRLARSIAETSRRQRIQLRMRSPIPANLLPSVLADLQLAIIRRWLQGRPGAAVEAVAHALTASAQLLVCGKDAPRGVRL
jgi:AcrR family transcriptional regulator